MHKFIFLTKGFAAALIILLIIISCAIGASQLHLDKIFTGDFDSHLFFYSRLPRSAAIIFTGASLAVAGMMMQILLGNRFVEPSLVGTTQSASLGLLFMIIFFPTAGLLPMMLVATIAALIGTFLFFQLISNLPKSNIIIVPLIGIIYGGIIAAMSTFIAFENNLLQLIEVWMNGEFSGVLKGRYELLWLSILMAITAYFFADRLTITGLGESIAINLGLNFKQTIYLGLTIIAIISAISVVSVGAMPFLGLVIPNIVSRIMGDNLRQSLPWVAYWGAILLLICDIIARIVNYPYEVPASLILGIIGTIIFLYLLLKVQRVI